MNIKIIRENRRYVIHYDIGGSPERFAKDIREGFARELQYHLKEIDSAVPMYQNKIWRPRKCRLAIPAGEMCIRRKKDISKAIDVLKTLIGQRCMGGAGQNLKAGEKKPMDAG